VTNRVGRRTRGDRATFAGARAASPCLLFFDEFDAIGANRQDLLTLHEQQMVNGSSSRSTSIAGLQAS